MSGRYERMRRLVVCAWLLASTGAAQAATLASLDLSGPLATRSAWRLTATQAPDVSDPIGEEDKVPGPVTLCLSRDAGRSCDAVTGRALVVDGKRDDFSEPHALKAARVVHPRLGQSLLLIQVASIRSGDGDQRNATQLLAYDRKRDTFRLVYGRTTGHNNNQEIRYVDAGPLAGDVIAAEPTGNAPFGFWITVDRLAATGGSYGQMLRYRSATRYNDGNSPAVIDSEMPEIGRRLGVWHPGQPLPKPAGACPDPHMVGAEMWCR